MRFLEMKIYSRNRPVFLHRIYDGKIGRLTRLLQLNRKNAFQLDGIIRFFFLQNLIFCTSNLTSRLCQIR